MRRSRLAVRQLTETGGRMSDLQSRARVARMISAVTAFLAALDPQQQDAVTVPFGVPDHRQWTYLPGPRAGLALADLSGEQQALALDLLDAGSVRPEPRLLAPSSSWT